MKKLLMAVTLLVPTTLGAGILAGVTPSYAASDTRSTGSNGTSISALPASVVDSSTLATYWVPEWIPNPAATASAATLAETGIVTALTDSSITIQIDNTDQSVTFALASSTQYDMQYDGTSANPSLVVGSHVQIDWTAGASTAARVILLAS